MRSAISFSSNIATVQLFTLSHVRRGAVTKFDEFIFISRSLRCLLVLHQSKINYHQLDINYIFAWMTATVIFGGESETLASLWDSVKCCKQISRTSFGRPREHFYDSWSLLRLPRLAQFNWHVSLEIWFAVVLFGPVAIITIQEKCPLPLCAPRRVNAQSPERFMWVKMCVVCCLVQRQL